MSRTDLTPDRTRTTPGAGHDPQLATPYADAVRAYAATPYVRLDVPGHAAQPQAQPELAAVFGEQMLRLDLPPLVDGVDQGPPTSKLRSAALAATASVARAAAAESAHGSGPIPRTSS